MRTKLLLAAIAALGLGLIVWALLLRESEEEAIRRRLDAISATVRIDPQEGVVARALRVRGGLDASFSKGAVIRIPELGANMGRDELVGIASQAGQRWQSGELGWSDVVVKVEGPRARVDARAKLSGTGPRGPGDEERVTELELEKVDGEWIVTRLIVTREEAGDEPAGDDAAEE